MKVARVNIKGYVITWNVKLSLYWKVSSPEVRAANRLHVWFVLQRRDIVWHCTKFSLSIFPSLNCFSLFTANRCFHWIFFSVLWTWPSWTLLMRIYALVWAVFKHLTSKTMFIYHFPFYHLEWEGYTGARGYF